MHSVRSRLKPGYMVPCPLLLLFNGAMLPPDLVTNPPTQNVASVSNFDDLDGDSDIEVGKEGEGRLTVKQQSR